MRESTIDLGGGAGAVSCPHTNRSTRDGRRSALGGPVGRRGRRLEGYEREASILERAGVEVEVYRRRYQCATCGHRWTTIEITHDALCALLEALAADRR